MGEVPEGRHDPEKGDERMRREDKVLLWILAVVGLGVLIALCIVVKVLLGLMGIAEEGIGFRTALLSGAGLSLTTVTLLALIAGDGVVGEFAGVFAAFVTMTAVSTPTIYLVF